MLPILLKKKNLKIILASKSPRRQELLRNLGIDFQVRSKDTNEDFPRGMAHQKIPVFLSQKKAAALADTLKLNEILITADTIVCVGDEVLNKPQNRKEAIEMIEKLNGKSHFVYTGVCIASANKEVVFSDQAKVVFSKLSLDEIEYYVDTFKPFDKAGAYGIQEWIGYAGIEKIDGSFYTVMGLPTQKLYVELKKFIA